MKIRKNKMKKKKQEKKKINNFTKKERLIISLSLFLILFFITLTYFIVFFEKADFVDLEDDEVIEKEEEIAIIDDNLSPRFIDGVLVENELANLYPIALILNNDPKIRYVEELNKASLVYELPTEGGTTRFLAIYASDTEIDKIGPIRSARPYFIDLAQDSSSLLVHCGGSPQALAQLAQDSIRSLNEFYYGRYFWRDKNISAPNNIFINSSSWQEFLENHGLRQVNKASWQFIQENELNEDLKIENDNILVYYSKNYQRNWYYNEDLRSYEASGDISAKNLVFHYANTKVLDDVLRLEINLFGEGKAIICQLGVCQEGKWKKANKNERLRYYNKSAEEIIFIAGNTWISVIGAGAYINY